MVSAARGGGRVDIEELLSRAENAQRRAGEAQLRQQQSEARQQAQQGASGASGGAQGGAANVGGAGASGACGPSVALGGGGSGASCVQQPTRPQVTPETQRGAREAARGREGPAMQDVQRRAVDERTPVTAKPEASQPNATPNQAAAKPPGAGLERQWKQFRDVDPDKMRAALPDRAKHLAQSFIDAGKKHNIDPVLLAAISRHETGNWTSAAFKRGNAMGISGTGGPRSFARPEDSVNQMAKQLADPNGYYKNATTLKDLWKIYAPSPAVGSRATNDPGGLNRHWGKNVDNYMSELEQRLG